jgi:3-hydroxyisobutyrate dehydrogenase
VKQAEEGQLVIMVGGNEAILEKAKPLFEHLGKITMLVGSTGAGNTAKLAINILLAFHAQGLAEAVVFARQNEIKTKDLMTLINNSALGNVFSKIKGDAIIQNNYKAAFALKHIAKDLRLAKEVGLATPLGETAFNTFQQAEPGLGEEDIIAIIKHVSSNINHYVTKILQTNEN